MAEEVSFPSPTALLRDSPPPAASAPASARPKNARRPSKETKKATLTKLSTQDASIVKPKQSKSRNGCVTCKAKRLKCDEEKPGCQQCAKRKVECGGYKKDFKWRPFEESNVRQRKASSPKQSAGSTSSTSPPQDSRTNHPDPLPRTALENSPGPFTARKDSHATKGKHPAVRRKSAAIPATPPENSEQSSPLEEQPDNTAHFNPTARSLSEEFLSGMPSPQRVMALNQSLSPTMTAQLTFPPSLLHDSSTEFVNFSMPEGVQLPMWHSAPDDTQFADNDTMLGNDVTDEDIEELMRPELNTQGLAFMSDAQLASRVPVSPLSAEEFLDHFGSRMPSPFNQPYFEPDGMEMVTSRFDHMTCGILSVMDGPGENPWRDLIWPLAPQSPALLHSILSMTSFHASADQPSLRVKGHEHKQLSLRYIFEGIEFNSIGKQTAIATALALGFAESWDTHTDTGNTHIKGAQALVKSALEDHKRQPLSGIDLARLKFLCNAWVYMDVIARLTALKSDDSTDFDNGLLFSRDSPRTILGSESLDDKGFGIDFGMPIDAKLDPLMGCAGSLFPLIGRVANLVRKVCRTRSNSPTIVETAQKLQDQLNEWEPPQYIERPKDPTTTTQHTMQTAEAYRYATLLHLHQSVPELPSPSSEELARAVLTRLATVPTTSRTVIVHIFPLMVAGCIQSEDDDREWVRKRWKAMAERMRIGVVEKSLQVTEEVWRRHDFYTSIRPGSFRLVATADFQPPREKGEKFVGTPGQGGTVYSLVGATEDFMLALSNEHPISGRPGNRVQEILRGPMDVAYTPRGHAHWVGVMWEWQWEVLLG